MEEVALAVPSSAAKLSSSQLGALRRLDMSPAAHRSSTAAACSLHCGAWAQLQMLMIFDQASRLRVSQWHICIASSSPERSSSGAAKHTSAAAQRCALAEQQELARLNLPRWQPQRRT